MIAWNSVQSQTGQVHHRPSGNFLNRIPPRTGDVICYPAPSEAENQNRFHGRPRSPFKSVRGLSTSCSATAGRPRLVRHGKAVQRHNAGPCDDAGNRLASIRSVAIADMPGVASSTVQSSTVHISGGSDRPTQIGCDGRVFGIASVARSHRMAGCWPNRVALDATSSAVESGSPVGTEPIIRGGAGGGDCAAAIVASATGCGSPLSRDERGKQ